MKKIIKMLVCLPLIFLLFACSTNANNVQPTTINISDYEMPENTDVLVDRRKYDDYYESIELTEKVQIFADPYDNSPLSALALFTTEKPAKINVWVEGKNEFADISHSFESYNTAHYIPIYGLYADHNNKVIITYTYEDKSTEAKTVFIRTDPLPGNMYDMTINVANQEKMAEGLTFIVSKYYFAIDANGDVRWYYTDAIPPSNSVARLENNNVVIQNKYTRDGYYVDSFYEMDLLGKIYNEYKVEGIHHEIREMANGNFLVAAQKYGPTTEDYVVEIDRENGEIVKEWDLTEILNLPLVPDEMYDIPTNNKQNVLYGVDWLHNNSVFYVEEDSSLLVSGRFQDLVAKIDYETGELIWIIADPNDDYPKNVQEKLLTPIGSDFEYPYGQHNVTTIPSGDILVFDNGNFRGKTEETAIDSEDNYSRAVIYSVNEADMTVSQLYQYGKERGNELYAASMGSAQYIAPEHLLINFGGIVADDVSGLRYDGVSFIPDETVVDRFGVIVEAIGDEVVFEMNVGGFEEATASVYQAQRLPLYAQNEQYAQIGGDAKRFGFLTPTATEDIKLQEPTVFNYTKVTFADDGTRIILDFILPVTSKEDEVYYVLEGEDNTYCYLAESDGKNVTLNINKDGIKEGNYVLGFVIERATKEITYTKTGYLVEI